MDLGAEWASQWQIACAADCRRCFSEAGGWMSVKMICCVTCGNKRCPKATDHRLDCTGSNEPGQEGSAYANWPTPDRSGEADKTENTGLAEGESGLPRSGRPNNVK